MTINIVIIITVIIIFIISDWIVPEWNMIRDKIYKMSIID